MTSLWRKLWPSLVDYARPHRRAFLIGLFTALVVVGTRLLLPWPIRAMLQPWVDGDEAASIGQIWPAAALFLTVVLVMGFADLKARLWFARFSIGFVRDMRHDAYRAAVGVGTSGRGAGAGELVARLIGDTARIKTGLKGFLVHVATNGVLFLGISTVLLWMYLPVGLVFAGAGLVLGLGTWLGARAIYKSAASYRTKEGQLAEAIHESSMGTSVSDSFAKVNRASGQHEASLTRIQGQTTWFAHGVFGIAVLLALWLCVKATTQGRLDSGDLLVLAMYAIVVRAPMVQLARQGSRTGKIVACTQRVMELVESAPPQGMEPALCMNQEIRLEGARLRRGSSWARRHRLGPIDLTIIAGQRIAVVGKPVSGKTTFLELIGGHIRPRSGRVLWDDAELVLRTRAAYVSEQPQWGRRKVIEMLGGDEKRAREAARRTGALSMIDALAKGIETTVSSDRLCLVERKRLALAHALTSESNVLLLDDIVAGMARRKAKKQIKRVMKFRPEATIVVTMRRPVAITKFDRVLEMRGGRVVFDGTPEQFKAARAARKPVVEEVGRDSERVVL